MKFLLPFLFVFVVMAPPDSHAEETPSPTQYYPEIADLIEQKKFAEALEVVEPLRKKFPETPEILLFQSAVLEGMGKYSECEDLALEFIEKKPDSINLDQAYFLLGSAQVKAGSRKAGLKALRTATQLTDDPSLSLQVERLIGSVLRSSEHIGIQLGGKPPISREDKEKLANVSIRILRRALRDYYENHQEYPNTLEDLLEGDPPTLLNLPVNPFSLTGRFDYERTESGFTLSEPSGKKDSDVLRPTSQEPDRTPINHPPHGN